MTYDPNIPKGEPSPASQQAGLKTNFSQFSAIFSSTSGGVKYNHSAINTGNQGKHEAIILTEQTSDPTITDDYDVLYNKLGQLFLRIPEFIPNGSFNNPMQLTYSTVNIAGPQYQSFLPGGYVLYIGSTTNIATPITVTPTPSSLLIAIAAANSLTTVGNPVSMAVGTTITQPDKFKIDSQNAPATYSVTWIAIGKQ